MYSAIGSTPANAPLSAPKEAPVVRRQGEVNAAASYWLEGMQRQGTAAFNKNPAGYKVFRNVKDYGARGGFLGE
jgi:glucan 1,3-beta-glucosidase